MPTPTLTDAVALFLADIGRGHSLKTVTTYRTSLNGFLAYLIEKQLADPATLPIAAIQTEWLLTYLRARADAPTPVSRTTLATYAAGLSRFYRWCSIERLVGLPTEEYERLLARVRDLKGTVRRTILNKVPSDAIVAALIAEARKERPASTYRGATDQTRSMLISLRDIALVEALACTGARVSELVSLNRADLDTFNRRVRVVGKGGKERWLYFSTMAWQALDAYLVARSKAITASAAADDATPQRGRATRRGLARDLSQPLFARHDRGAPLTGVKPLTARAVQRCVLELADRAEIESVVTPHTFRHWVATHLLAATHDLAVTQDLLGHASPTTTRIYAQVSETAKQEAHRTVFN